MARHSSIDPPAQCSRDWRLTARRRLERVVAVAVVGGVGEIRVRRGFPVAEGQMRALSTVVAEIVVVVVTA